MFGRPDTAHAPDSREDAARWVLVFDLDDTLTDTWGLLILPIEEEAAATYPDAAGASPNAREILETLVQARKSTPHLIEQRMLALLGQDAAPFLARRREIAERVLVERLNVATAVHEMLARLAVEFRLILLTEGNPGIQRAKVTHLGLEAAFESVLVVDRQSGETKTAALQKLVDHAGMVTSNAVIIGNRADNELAAGRAIGARTIWVRRGEGSEMEGHATNADAIVHDVLAIPDLVSAWLRDAGKGEG